MFGSTSKISFAGGGVSFLGSSPANLAWWLRHAGKRTIGPNRIVQLQHAQFFGSPDGVLAHMQKHRAILEPKFAAVQQALSRARWAACPTRRGPTPPAAISSACRSGPGRRRGSSTLAAEAGVKLTPAGAPFPYGKDPEDSNIRIAPSYPPIGELEEAMAVLTDCVVLAAEESVRRLSGAPLVTPDGALVDLRSAPHDVTSARHEVTSARDPQTAEAMACSRGTRPR